MVNINYKSIKYKIIFTQVMNTNKTKNVVTHSLFYLWLKEIEVRFETVLFEQYIKTELPAFIQYSSACTKNVCTDEKFVTIVLKALVNEKQQNP